MATRDTPAARAHARRDPAIQLPPRADLDTRRAQLLGLILIIAGVSYLLGPSLEGDPPTAADVDGAATITLTVRDVDGTLQRALAANEPQVLAGAVTITVDSYVYVLQSVDVDTDTGQLLTMVFIDQVAWRLDQYTKPLTISRAKSTRAQAALRLVNEASTRPLAPINAYIPQLNDVQPIAKPDTKGMSTASGTGARGSYRVKGRRATAGQRNVIDQILTEAKAEKASQRVMVAAMMAPTQESALDPGAANGNHLGIYQQDPGWGTAAARRDPTRATRAFLAAWKRVHGSLSHGPGDLAAAIEAVQHSGQPSLYAQWESESTDTVKTWTGKAGSTRTVIEPFEFTRGSRDGQSESSWAALQRWAQEVNWRRWAQRNTLFYASDDELRAAAPVLEIHGDEPWLLSPPAGQWNPKRLETEVTFRVLADRFAIQIGACIWIATGTVQGRFLVATTAGYTVNPELTVTARRPSPAKPEPAHTEQTTTSGSASDKASGLLAECKKISADDRDYLLGGGHGVKLSSIGPKDPLDCSSACCLALWRAGLYHHDTAMTSGQLAATFGSPGKGDAWTLQANAEHVWIEFETGTVKRFDTSPHGDGPSGPHTRTTARNDQARFTQRHITGA